MKIKHFETKHGSAYHPCKRFLSYDFDKIYLPNQYILSVNGENENTPS